MTHHADGHALRRPRHADAFLHCRNNPLRGNDGLNRLRRMSMRMPRRQWPADIFSSSKCFSLLKNNFQRWQRYSIRIATWLQRPPCLDELHEGGKSLCNRPAGGACPKNAPSGASTPSRVAQKADRALNCGLFGQPGGGEHVLKVPHQPIPSPPEHCKRLIILRNSDFPSRQGGRQMADSGCRGMSPAAPILPGQLFRDCGTE